MLRGRSEEWRTAVNCPNESAVPKKSSSAAVAYGRRHLVARQRNDMNASTSSFDDGRARMLERSRAHAQALESFEQMLLTSRTRFVAMAYSILQNREDAEDAVQNAFFSAYLHLRNFEGRAALRTWFTRIVVNAALMIRRKRKPSRFVPLMESEPGDEITFWEQIPASGPDPEKNYGDEEALQQIDAQLVKMSPVLRQAFAMTYYDELSHREACQALDIPIGTFKARLFRARRLVLRRVLPTKKKSTARLPAQSDLRSTTLQCETTAPLEPALS